MLQNVVKCNFKILYIVQFLKKYKNELAYLKTTQGFDHRGGGTQTGQSRDFLYFSLCNWTTVF